MILIPAIDIKDNNCVRLEKGNFKKINIFSKNVLLVVNKWLNLNFNRIHVVDLDGALLGRPKNLLSIKNIINYVNKRCEIQIGGGIRDFETIDYYFDLGVNYVILGTKAILDLKFLETASFKNNNIILSVDFKNLKIAINGWKNYYKLNLIDYLKEINNFPINSIIYTDTSRDGTLKGLNLDKFLKFSKNSNFPIIVSGGMANISDIKNIFSLQINNLYGIICGKSIYLGKINIYNILNKIKFFNKYYIE